MSLQESVEKLSLKHSEAQELAIKIREHAAELSEFADRLESGAIEKKAASTHLGQNTRQLLSEYNRIRATVYNLVAGIK